jgi:hypothetical protein
MILTTENINALIEEQLQRWEEARNNFFRLRECRRKPLVMGDLQGAAQLNPARIRSTGAAVDKKSIAARPCFLCRGNRPKEQIAIEDFEEGWELLVNPYPILPVHFTIVSKKHIPQAEMPLEMASMAEKAPTLAFFFNGAKAGASAPDHLHVQAVLSEELPLLRLAAEHHPVDKPGFMTSEEMGINVPFQFVSAVVSPDMQGMMTLAKLPEISGTDADGNPDKGLVNAFCWMDRSGLLRALVIPRRAHRPSCYTAVGEEQMMISPGAIDMAGIAILPREEDFERITPEIMQKVYHEVANHEVATS